MIKNLSFLMMFFCRDATNFISFRYTYMFVLSMVLFFLFLNVQHAYVHDIFEICSALMMVADD
jgi:hypothetical protein